VPLELHVDYWDELGWPDPFASPSFTERQRRYATREGRIYTPQAVVDGRTELVGSHASALERAIAEAGLSARTLLSTSLQLQRVVPSR
jgi:hypothetical protein